MFYIVLLVSAVQQCESAIIIYIAPPPWTFLPSPTPPGHHRATGWVPVFFFFFPFSIQIYLFIFLALQLFFFFLLYNIVLVLPYINMNLPQVYTCSQSWTALPPPSPYYPSGSSQCTSPKHPVSCIEPGLAIRILYVGSLFFIATSHQLSNLHMIVYANAIFSICLTLSFPLWISKSILYICTSIPSLQMCSSILFFYIPTDIC